jgi:hypothetical protein
MALKKNSYSGKERKHASKKDSRRKAKKALTARK